MKRELLTDDFLLLFSSLSQKFLPPDLWFFSSNHQSQSRLKESPACWCLLWNASRVFWEKWARHTFITAATTLLSPGIFRLRFTACYDGTPRSRWRWRPSHVYPVSLGPAFIHPYISRQGTARYYFPFRCAGGETRGLKKYEVKIRASSRGQDTQVSTQVHPEEGAEIFCFFVKKIKITQLCNSLSRGLFPGGH